MTYSLDMHKFFETQLFTRLAGEYLGDLGLLALQAYLIAQPTTGTGIPGSGGVRSEP